MFSDTLKKIKIDSRLNGVVDGQLDMSFLGFNTYNKNNYYPLPPFVIPILIDFDSSPLILGYAKHWFVDRKEVFVKVYASSGYMTIEVARNVDQLFTLWVLNSIVNNDGVDDSILNFTNNLGFKNTVEDVDKYSLLHGDEISNIEYFKEFKNYSPVNAIIEKDKYNGDFPSSERYLFEDNLNTACYFEVSSHSETNFKQPWLRKNNSFSLFENYLKNNDLEKAWLSLNGYGLSPKEVSRGLELLIEKSDNEDFIVYAKTWITSFENSQYDLDNELKFI